MTKYIFRRLVFVLPLVLVVATLVFMMLRLGLKGDPALSLAGERATPELIERIRVDLGLNLPLTTQFVHWLLGNDWLVLRRHQPFTAALPTATLQLPGMGRGYLAEPSYGEKRGVVRGDFGRSFNTREPVAPRIFSSFPFTIQLTAQTVALGTALGILVGVITALNRATWADKLVTVIVIFGYSFPTFVLGAYLILLFAVQWRWLPVQGSGSWQHMVMPTITLGLGQVALIARLTRSSMIETLGEDYIRTARAKGLSERAVVLRHGLRNSLIPIITIVGLSFGGLLGGAIITERIFNLPGLGTIVVRAIAARDYPMIQGAVLLTAVTFILVNLGVDIVYGFADPRIRYE